MNNKEKWISGIVEETTCGDVVKVIFLTLTFLTPLESNLYFRVFRYFIRVLMLLVSKSIIMKALLAAEGRLKGINEEQLDKFVMVERWRKVEKIETIMMMMLMMMMIREYCKYGRGCRKYASLAYFDPHCWVFAD